MRMLLVFLTDLMELLQPARIKRAHIQTAVAWYDELDNLTGGGTWRSEITEIKDVKGRLSRANKNA